MGAAGPLRLPRDGDVVTLDLRHPSGAEADESSRRLAVTVCAVERRVPATVRLRWAEMEAGS